MTSYAELRAQQASFVARARLQRINPKPGSRFLFAVLHTTVEHDTAKQAQLALDAGADGVLLCAWPASIEVMLRKLAEVRAAVGADYFVGVNFMQSGEALGAALGTPLARLGMAPTREAARSRDRKLGCECEGPLAGRW